MKLVIFYLLLWLAGLAWLVSVALRGLLPIWINDYELAFNCALIGSLGGVIYCLRAVYLNKCVNGAWDDNWTTWYFLRPLVSLLIGVVAYVFLKAGILVLGSNGNEVENPFGFLSLSFIAGLNVDKFLIRIEKLAKTTWGVQPSRTSTRSEHSDKDAH